MLLGAQLPQHQHVDESIILNEVSTKLLVEFEMSH